MIQPVDVPHTRPRTVLITGVTGFVGQAVLERFLREGATVHVLIRPSADQGSAERLDDLLGKAAFDPWRQEVGPAGVARSRSRLHVIEGDLSRPLPTLPSGLDLVVHSASTVTFDAPIDRALGSNVLGARHLYEALARSGCAPHVVHISTSYVGTGRTAVAMEESVEHDVDWRAEVTNALDRRAALPAAEADSRLREIGRRRAHDLGWTDVYTMSKALGERVAEDLWAATGNRLTILRPTIIESALHRPAPGWIDGFKVADPLIAAYAKDRLVAFPGRPEAVLDVVPVDVVVDGIIAASHLPPSAGDTRYLQIGTSTSNPITLEEFRIHVESAVRAAPWTDRAGSPIHPRPWRFLTPGDIQSWARRRVRALRVAERALRPLPRAVTGRLRRRLALARRDLTTLTGYVDIYQPYTCSSTVYDDTQTRRLLTQASELGLEGALDVTRIDWERYLRGTHLPSLATLARAHRIAKGDGPTAPRGRRPSRRRVATGSMTAAGA